LFHTIYACSSLTLLSGGTANFLFRGILAQPLEDGTKTIVLKHSEEFVAANRNFELDVTRCVRFAILCFASMAILTFETRLSVLRRSHAQRLHPFYINYSRRDFP
jgi:hypothetical protein